MERSRAPAQEASRLSQWAAGPWTAVQSTCQIPPPTTWISVCPSADKRGTPDKSLKVSACSHLILRSVLGDLITSEQL